MSDAKDLLKECLLNESEIYKARKYWYRVRYYEVNKNLEFDQEMKKLVDATIADYKDNKLDEIVSTIDGNLDCTEFSLLNGECNSANFITDVIRVSCKCDCVILSATSFLSNDQQFDQKNNDEFLGGPSASNFNIDGSINKGNHS